AYGPAYASAIPLCALLSALAASGHSASASDLFNNTLRRLTGLPTRERDRGLCVFVENLILEGLPVEAARAMPSLSKDQRDLSWPERIAAQMLDRSLLSLPVEDDQILAELVKRCTLLERADEAWDAAKRIKDPTLSDAAYSSVTRCLL